MKRLLNDYGMLFVLLALCAFFSVLTHSEQHPSGVGGAVVLARDLKRELRAGATVMIAARGHAEDVAFAGRLRESALPHRQG